MLIDIHTHKSCPEYISILNAFSYKLGNHQTLDKFTSIGFHPDHIKSNYDFIQYEAVVNKYLVQDKLLALGEVGLDRRFNTINLQLNFFEKCIILAGKTNLPLIIHCVKAYSELLKLRKKYKNQNWVVHGFRGKPELAIQLWDAEICTSFGSAVLNPAASLMNTIEICPLDRLFLETDCSDVSISNIYQRFSEIRGIALDELSTIIKSNFINMFGVKI